MRNVPIHCRSEKKCCASTGHHGRFSLPAPDGAGPNGKPAPIWSGFPRGPWTPCVGAVQGWLSRGTSSGITHRMGPGKWSVHLGNVADHAVHISFPGLHAHDGEDGIDTVVLFAVDGFYIESVDLKNAEDVAVLNHALGDAIAMVPHVVGLFIEREPIEGAEVHISWIEFSCDRTAERIRLSIRDSVLRGFILLNLCGMSEVDGSAERWQLTDCPRDAMQGVVPFIPTERKVAYLSALMEVGFDVLDAGSFVSPKAIPQMADTAEVLAGLPETDTQVLAIVANLRGAQDALGHGRPDLIGFPFSISETFQQRNTGGGIEEGWRRLEEIRDAVDRAGRRMVVYLSMGFGNPYGDPWSEELAANWADRLHRELGVEQLALSDTVGKGDAQVIEAVCASVTSACPNLVVGAHLHGRREQAGALMAAAWNGGCRHFDGALGGFGGCPMAKDELVGNLPTEVLMEAPAAWGGQTRSWNAEALSRAQEQLSSLF